MHHEGGAEAWDRMYQHKGAGHSSPNPYMDQEITELVPGTALDVGCGEGADALWLALRGWVVTAVDFSGVALQRARAADPDQRVTWMQSDILAWRPPEKAFDLVLMHYIHVPVAARDSVFGRFAATVRAGGVLFVAAHHPSDVHTTVARPPDPNLHYTAEEIARVLPAEQWQVLFAGTRPREARDRSGGTITIKDTVLKAKRLS